MRMGRTDERDGDIEKESKQTRQLNKAKIHTHKDTHTFNEIPGVHLRLPVLEAGQPGSAVMAGAAAAAAAATGAAAAWTAHPALLVFVEPVRGQAHLGDGVHPNEWVEKREKQNL